MKNNKCSAIFLFVFVFTAIISISCGEINKIDSNRNETVKKTSSSKTLFESGEEKIKIMPVKDIKAGMKGYGLTVYRGTEPEKFFFEIIGVKNMREGSVTDSPVILAKLTGGPKDFSSDKTGVVAGMSGSPMYINGKLIGALAYGFNVFEKDPICGIQPAENMLNPQIGAREKNRMSGFDKRNIPLVLNMPTNLVKSFSKKNRIGEDFYINNFVVQPAIDSSNYERSYGDLRIKPGSSIAVYLIRGDIAISATGTVTMVDGDKIYAFGHPFFGIGKTNLLFHQNEIITINSSWMNSFKMAGGDAGTVKGTIITDYYSAIFGRVGKLPQTIAVKIVSNGIKSSRTLNMEFMKQRFVTSLLVRYILPGVLRDMYEEVRYAPPGTKQKISITTGIVFDSKTQTLEMEESFGTSNSSASSFWSYGYMLDSILSVIEKKNKFNKVTGINIEIALTEVSRSGMKSDAGISDEVKIVRLNSKDKAVPGKVFKADISLSATRGDETTKYIIGVPIQIPEDAEVGEEKIELSVASGFGIVDNNDIEKMDFNDTVVYYNNLMRPGLFLAMKYIVKKEKGTEKVGQDKAVRFGSISSHFVKKVENSKSRKIIFNIPSPAAFGNKANFRGKKVKKFNVQKEEEKARQKNSKIEKKKTKQKSKRDKTD